MCQLTVCMYKSVVHRTLLIAITKTGVDTTRRCDLTSVLYRLIFDTVYES